MATLRHGKYALRVAAAVAVLFLATACGGVTPSTQAPSDPSQMAVGAVEAGRPAGVAWLDDSHLIVSRAANADDPASPFGLATFDLVRRAWNHIGLEQLPGCQRTEYLAPQRLPDGRLGAMRRCFPPNVTDEISQWLVAIDLDSSEITELTGDLGGANVSSYSWNRDMSDAWVSVGSRICQTVQRATPAGLRPLEVEITKGATSFDLADMREDATVPGDEVPTGAAAEALLHLWADEIPEHGWRSALAELYLASKRSHWLVVGHHVCLRQSSRLDFTTSWRPSHATAVCPILIRGQSMTRRLPRDSRSSAAAKRCRRRWMPPCAVTSQETMMQSSDARASEFVARSANASVNLD